MTNKGTYFYLRGNFILKGKKAITSFLRDNGVIMGAPKWSYQVSGTHHPWASIIISEKGTNNCYLDFKKNLTKRINL